VETLPARGYRHCRTGSKPHYAMAVPYTAACATRRRANRLLQSALDVLTQAAQKSPSQQRHPRRPQRRRDRSGDGFRPPRFRAFRRDFCSAAVALMALPAPSQYPETISKMSASACATNWLRFGLAG